MDTLYCLTKKDPKTRQILYQPKVITTFNLEVHDRAMKEYGNNYQQNGYEYSSETFTGAELLFLQLRNSYC